MYSPKQIDWPRKFTTRRSSTRTVQRICYQLTTAWQRCATTISPSTSNERSPTKRWATRFTNGKNAVCRKSNAWTNCRRTLLFRRIRRTMRFSKLGKDFENLPVDSIIHWMPFIVLAYFGWLSMEFKIVTTNDITRPNRNAEAPKRRSLQPHCWTRRQHFWYSSGDI